MLLRCRSAGYVGGIQNESPSGGVSKVMLTLPHLERNLLSFTATCDSVRLAELREAPPRESFRRMIEDCLKPALAESLLERWFQDNAFDVRITRDTSGVGEESTCNAVRQLRFGRQITSAQLASSLLVPTPQSDDLAAASEWLKSTPRDSLEGAVLVEYVGGGKPSTSQPTIRTPLDPDVWFHYMLKESAVARQGFSDSPSTFVVELSFVLLVDGCSGKCSLTGTQPSPIQPAAPPPLPPPSASIEALIAKVQNIAFGDPDGDVSLESDDFGDDGMSSGAHHAKTWTRSVAQDRRRRKRTQTLGVRKLLIQSSAAVASPSQPPSATHCRRQGLPSSNEPRELVSPTMALSLGAICSNLRRAADVGVPTTGVEKLERAFASHRNPLMTSKLVSTLRRIRCSSIAPSHVDDVTEVTHCDVALPLLIPTLLASTRERLKALRQRYDLLFTAPPAPTVAESDPMIPALPRTVLEDEAIEECNVIDTPSIKTRASMRRAEYDSQFTVVDGVRTRIAFIGELKPNCERSASRPTSPQQPFNRRNKRIKRRHLLHSGIRTDVSDMFATSSTSTDVDTGDCGGSSGGGPPPCSTPSDNSHTTNSHSGEDDNDTSSGASSRQEVVPPLADQQQRGGPQSFCRPSHQPPTENIPSLESSMSEHRGGVGKFRPDEEPVGLAITRRDTITPTTVAAELQNRSTTSSTPTSSSSPTVAATPQTMVRMPSVVRAGQYKKIEPKELERSQRPHRVSYGSEQMEVPAPTDRLAWNRAYQNQEADEERSLQAMSRRISGGQQSRPQSQGDQRVGGSTPEGPDVAPGDWVVPLRPPSCTMRTYVRREHARAEYLRRYIEHQERVQQQKSKENILAAMRLLAKLPAFGDDGGIFGSDGSLSDEDAEQEGGGAVALNDANTRATYPSVVSLRPAGSPDSTFRPMCRFGSKPNRKRGARRKKVAEKTAAPPNEGVGASGNVASDDGSGGPQSTGDDESSVLLGASAGSLSPTHYYYFGEIPYGRASALSFHSDGVMGSASFTSRPGSTPRMASPSSVFGQSNTSIPRFPHRPSQPNTNTTGVSYAPAYRMPRARPFSAKEDLTDQPFPNAPPQPGTKAVRFSGVQQHAEPPTRPEVAVALPSPTTVVDLGSSSELCDSIQANLTQACFAATRAPAGGSAPFSPEQVPLGEGTEDTCDLTVTPSLVAVAKTPSRAPAEPIIMLEEHHDERREEGPMEAPDAVSISGRNANPRGKQPSIFPVPPSVAVSNDATPCPRRYLGVRIELGGAQDTTPTSPPTPGMRRPLSFHVPLKEIPEINIIDRTPSVMSAFESGSDVDAVHDIHDTPRSTAISKEPPALAMLN